MDEYVAFHSREKYFEILDLFSRNELSVVDFGNRFHYLYEEDESTYDNLTTDFNKLSEIQVPDKDDSTFSDFTYWIWGIFESMSLDLGQYDPETLTSSVREQLLSIYQDYIKKMRQIN